MVLLVSRGPMKYAASTGKPCMTKPTQLTPRSLDASRMKNGKNVSVPGLTKKNEVLYYAMKAYDCPVPNQPCR